MLTSLVGPRHSERLICAALLPSADDAMNIGLVDYGVPLRLHFDDKNIVKYGFFDCLFKRA